MATAPRKVTRVRRKPQTDLQHQVARLSELRDEAKAATEAAKTVQESVMAMMEAEGYTPGQKITATRTDGQTVSAQIVQGSSLHINDNLLRKRLGATLWAKVTTRILDRRKLDAYIASGEIPPATVAACSNETPSTPYIKIGK